MSARRLQTNHKERRTQCKFGYGAKVNIKTAKTKPGWRNVVQIIKRIFLILGITPMIANTLLWLVKHFSGGKLSLKGFGLCAVLSC